MFKDMFGRDIKVGDSVAYVEGKYIQVQKVNGFKTQKGGDIVHYVTFSDDYFKAPYGGTPKKKKAASSCFIVTGTDIAN